MPAALADLPNELIQQICLHLCKKADQFRLVRTSHRLNEACASVFYQKIILKERRTSTTTLSEAPTSGASTLPTPARYLPASTNEDPFGRASSWPGLVPLTLFLLRRPSFGAHVRQMTVSSCNRIDRGGTDSPGRPPAGAKRDDDWPREAVWSRLHAWCADEAETREWFLALAGGSGDAWLGLLLTSLTGLASLDVRPGSVADVVWTDSWVCVALGRGKSVGRMCVRGGCVDAADAFAVAREIASVETLGLLCCGLRKGWEDVPLTRTAEHIRQVIVCACGVGRNGMGIERVLNRCPGVKDVVVGPGVSKTCPIGIEALETIYHCTPAVEKLSLDCEIFRIDLMTASPADFNLGWFKQLRRLRVCGEYLLGAVTGSSNSQHGGEVRAARARVLAQTMPASLEDLCLYEDPNSRGMLTTELVEMVVDVMETHTASLRRLVIQKYHLSGDQDLALAKRAALFGARLQFLITGPNEEVRMDADVSIVRHIKRKEAMGRWRQM